MDGMIALALLRASSMLFRPGANYSHWNEQIKEDSGAFERDRIRRLSIDIFVFLCNPPTSLLRAFALPLPYPACQDEYYWQKKLITSTFLLPAHERQLRDPLYAFK